MLETVLARKGHRVATVVVELSAPDDILKAADDLARCLGAIVGEKSATVISDGEPAPEGVLIYLGETSATKEAGIDGSDLEVNGCRIVAADDRVHIVGGSDLGLRHGIYTLLGEYLDVIWGMADEIFEDIPERDVVTIGPMDISHNPPFGFRVFSGSVATWNNRNRIDDRAHTLKYYGHGHNLFRILPPSKFSDHPDYYAFVEGRRHVPEADGHTKENPCFTNPDVIRITIDTVRQAFDEKPDQTTYSLCPNDSDFFCECPNCQELDQGRKKFRSRNIYSDSYFYYVEAVAKEIAKSHPDRFLGTYAYWCTELPPRKIEKLSGNVVVYLTQDSSQYYDPDYQRRDFDMLRTWNKAAAHLCVYDYYGLSWITPRVYSDITARTLPFLPSVGVHGFYCEVYPYWAHTGPQLYLATRLLWDLSSDSTKIMDRYMKRMFREVAEPMNRFYEILEEVWRESTMSGRWFEGLNDPHIQVWRWSPGQRDKAWEAINAVRIAATNEVTKKRVEYVFNGFHHAYVFMKAFHRAIALRDVQKESELRQHILAIANDVEEREQVYKRVLEPDESYTSVYYRDIGDKPGNRFGPSVAKWRQSIGMRIEEALYNHSDLRTALASENATVSALLGEAESEPLF